MITIKDANVWVLSFLFVLWHTQNVFAPPHLKEVALVAPNPNVIASSWVVEDLWIDVDGGVKSVIALKGDDPFRGTVLSSVSLWRFTPAYASIPVESHVAAVFLFRPRDIFSWPAPDLSGISIAGLNRAPIPINISDPGYMTTSIAEGQVILELQLSEAGVIQSIRVINGVFGLTEFTQRAVRSWRFVPALSNGIPVPGTVVVVASYLRTS